MSIFDIDYINTVWKLLLPPDKLLQKWQGWGATVMEGKQWHHNAIFTTYANGDTADSAYNPGATYTTGTRVLYPIQSYSAGYTGADAYYGDNGVYEAISINADGTNNSGFTNTPPVGNNIVPSEMPATITNAAEALAWLSQYNWIKVSSNFLGANDRALFNASRLVFEYALNAWFSSTFRQPGDGNSDIYIVPNQRLYDYLYMGPAGNGYNYIPSEYNLATPYVPYNSTPESMYDFTIKVYYYVYDALSPVSGHREQIVRNFADKLNAAGMLYNVEIWPIYD